jgi:hypothetical protein
LNNEERGILNDLKQSLEYFTCVELHRDDIVQYGEYNLDDDDMQSLADDIGESLMDMWWVSLETLLHDKF